MQGQTPRPALSPNPRRFRRQSGHIGLPLHRISPNKMRGRTCPDFFRSLTEPGLAGIIKTMKDCCCTWSACYDQEFEPVDRLGISQAVNTHLGICRSIPRGQGSDIPQNAGSSSSVCSPSAPLPLERNLRGTWGNRFFIQRCFPAP